MGDNKSDHVSHIKAILKHLSAWKGGKSLPSLANVVELCKLKILYDEHEHKKHSKFQLLQLLVPHLIREMQEHDRSYVPPIATSNHAKLLFPPRVCATITEPVVVPAQVVKTITEPVMVPAQVVKTITEPVADSPTRRKRKKRIVELTGVATFKSMREYRAFVRVGQHPMHASPCVCAEGLNCSSDLVYEEWMFNQKTSKGSQTQEYRCRRRRRERKRKQTETNQSKEYKNKAVKCNPRSKKGHLH